MIQRFTVTISVNVDINDRPEGVTLEQIAEMMTHDKWSDGRYPFHTEMLQEGLRYQIKLAIQGATFTQMRVKYGHEMIEEGTGSYSLANRKTEEAVASVSVYMAESIQAAEIKPCST